MDNEEDLRSEHKDEDLRSEHKDEDLRGEYKEKAAAILGRLSAEEREALLIKGWMSHDARWFMAVAGEFGIEAANRLNQIAAHEVGKVDARRTSRALELPPATSLEDFLLAQEIFIGLLGPDLVDYRVARVGDSTCEVQLQRCFAYENVARAGVADTYYCGIFPRFAGWLEALDLEYEMSPSPGRCLKAEGRECVYEITIKGGSEAREQS